MLDYQPATKLYLVKRARVPNHILAAARVSDGGSSSGSGGSDEEEGGATEQDHTHNVKEGGAGPASDSEQDAAKQKPVKQKVCKIT